MLSTNYLAKDDLARGVLSTIKHVDEHPWRAWLRYRISRAPTALIPYQYKFVGPLDITWRNKIGGVLPNPIPKSVKPRLPQLSFERDPAIYDILRNLTWLGFDDTITKLKEHLEKVDSTNQAYRQALEVGEEFTPNPSDPEPQNITLAFVDKLYDIWEVLNETGSDDINPGLIKAFKKQIHDLVERQRNAVLEQVLDTVVDELSQGSKGLLKKAYFKVIRWRLQQLVSKNKGLAYSESDPEKPSIQQSIINYLRSLNTDSHQTFSEKELLTISNIMGSFDVPDYKRIVNLNKNLVKEEEAAEPTWREWTSQKVDKVKFWKKTPVNEVEEPLAPERLPTEQRPISSYEYLQKRLHKRERDTPFKSDYILSGSTPKAWQDTQADADSINKVHEAQAKIDSLRPTTEPDKKKKKIRWLKWLADKISLISTADLSAGEGIAAAVLSGFNIILSICLIATSGAIANFFLFRPYSQETFKNLFLGRVFKDKDGRKVSWLKTLLILPLTIFAFSGAIAIGFVSWLTATHAIAALIATLSSIAMPILLPVTFAISFIAATLCTAETSFTRKLLIVLGATTVITGTIAGLLLTPIVPLIIPILLATGTTIALGCAFFVTLAGFITHNRHLAIKDFFVKTYGLYGYRNATAGDWMRHILKCSLVTTALVGALALTVIATVASAGLYHNKAVFVLHNTMGIVANKSHALAYVFIDTLGTYINFTAFNLDNNAAFMLRSVGVLKAVLPTKLIGGVISTIIHPVKTFNKLSEVASQFKSAPLTTTWDGVKSVGSGIKNKFVNIGSAIKAVWQRPIRSMDNTEAMVVKGGLLVGCVANGVGQGLGMISPSSIHDTSRIDGLTGPAAACVDGTAGTVNSIGANAVAVDSKTTLPSKACKAVVTQACLDKAARMLWKRVSDPDNPKYVAEGHSYEPKDYNPKNIHNLAKAIAVARSETISEGLTKIFQPKDANPSSQSTAENLKQMRREKTFELFEHYRHHHHHSHHHEHHHHGDGRRSRSTSVVTRERAVSSECEEGMHIDTTTYSADSGLGMLMQRNGLFQGAGDVKSISTSSSVDSISSDTSTDSTSPRTSTHVEADFGLYALSGGKFG